MIFHAQDRVHLFFLPPHNHMPSQDTIAGTNSPDAFPELPEAEFPSEELPSKELPEPKLPGPELPELSRGELPGEQAEGCGDATGSGSGRGPRGVGDGTLGEVDTWERNRVVRVMKMKDNLPARSHCQRKSQPQTER